MRIPSQMPRALMLALAAMAASFVFASRAAQTPAPTSTSSAGQVPASTTAQPLTLAAPQSVFVNPATTLDGKDPFFPQSTRHRPPPPVSVPIATKAAPPPVELELKGISGTPERRLAIINNATFETGEQAEVVTNVGRVRITCKEIKADSVEVVVNGQSRVLSMRSKL
jgi:hypothetical protein